MTEQKLPGLPCLGVCLLVLWICLAPGEPWEMMENMPQSYTSQEWGSSFIFQFPIYQMDWALLSGSRTLNTSGSACNHAPCPGGETQAFPVISEVNAERIGWGANSIGWRSLSGNHTLCLKKKNKIICILPQRVEHSTKRDIRYRVLRTDTNKMLQDCANGGGEEMRMTDRNYSLR